MLVMSAIIIIIMIVNWVLCAIYCCILVYTVYGGHLPAHHRVETIRQASFGALGNLKNILGLQLKK